MNKIVKQGLWEILIVFICLCIDLIYSCKLNNLVQISVTIIFYLYTLSILIDIVYKTQNGARVPIAKEVAFITCMV